MIYWELAACQRERHARLQRRLARWLEQLQLQRAFTAVPRTGLDPLTGMGSVSILRMLQVIP